jgi:hypothetical protein
MLPSDWISSITVRHPVMIHMIASELRHVVCLGADRLVTVTSEGVKTKPFFLSRRFPPCFGPRYIQS